MRVSASVTAMTRSPSSAVRRSSDSTRSTAVCSGESRQIAWISSSSASGASVTSTGMAAWLRAQLVRISGRTRSSTSSPRSTKLVQARTASSRLVFSSPRTTWRGYLGYVTALTGHTVGQSRRPAPAGGIVTHRPVPPPGADDVGTTEAVPASDDRHTKGGRLKASVYDLEMEKLQERLVMLQYWIQRQGLKVLVIFEGRGSAGKGGVISRITERTSPRTVRVVALPKPTDRQRTQWYFQRYVEHLPAAGEMVLFDRSWYNRSNVEWVMGYCTEEEHQEFLRSCPEFERMLVRSGITVVKYWFSVSFDEQRRRFEARNAEPRKRWKLSDIDVAEHELYVRYSMAKDTTFQHTDIKQAPWYVVPSDDKRASRLNCISHLLRQLYYVDVARDVVELPRMREIPYVRPPMHEQTFVPRKF